LYLYLFLFQNRDNESGKSSNGDGDYDVQENEEQQQEQKLAEKGTTCDDTKLTKKDQNEEEEGSRTTGELNYNPFTFGMDLEEAERDEAIKQYKEEWLAQHNAGTMQQAPSNDIASEKNESTVAADMAIDLHVSQNNVSIKTNEVKKPSLSKDKVNAQQQQQQQQLQLQQEENDSEVKDQDLLLEQKPAAKDITLGKNWMQKAESAACTSSLLLNVDENDADFDGVSSPNKKDTVCIFVQAQSV